MSRITFRPNGSPRIGVGAPIFVPTAEEIAALDAIANDPDGAGALPVDDTMTAAKALTNLRQREFLARELEAIARKTR